MCAIRAPLPPLHFFDLDLLYFSPLRPQSIAGNEEEPSAIFQYLQASTSVHVCLQPHPFARRLGYVFPARARYPLTTLPRTPCLAQCQTSLKAAWPCVIDASADLPIAAKVCLPSPLSFSFSCGPVFLPGLTPPRPSRPPALYPFGSRPVRRVPRDGARAPSLWR